MSAATIKPIETRYKGYRFRSRLEARWAVYFDAIGLKWEYEPQGFDLGGGLLYLPDFWLPQVELWGEVKPEPLDATEMDKAARLAEQTGQNVLLLVGMPALRPYPAVLGQKDAGHEGKIAGEVGGEYCLSNSYGYLQSERRFYVFPGIRDDDEKEFARCFPDAADGVMAARSARFEHGETPGVYR